MHKYPLFSDRGIPARLKAGFNMGKFAKKCYRKIIATPNFLITNQLSEEHIELIKELSTWMVLPC